MRRLKKQDGLTLIETTVILAVVTVLSGMLAPSILQFMEDSKITRARNDVRAIAASLGRFFQDTGHFPVTFDSHQGGLGSSFIDVLVSEGMVPKVVQGATSTKAGKLVSGRFVAAAGSDQGMWISGQRDFLVNHLVKNRSGFLLRTTESTRGWNGPYLNSDMNSDPWGNQYLINVTYLDSEAGVANASGVPKNAVFVLCAGPNQTIETPFTQPITDAEIFGDDIGSRVR